MCLKSLRPGEAVWSVESACATEHRSASSTKCEVIVARFLVRAGVLEIRLRISFRLYIGKRLTGNHLLGPDLGL